MQKYAVPDKAKIDSVFALKITRYMKKQVNTVYNGDSDNWNWPRTDTDVRIKRIMLK